MNDKFFKLPKEKQQRIINAAYKVFSKNSYKKASMSEIAAEGGISKSLLFHFIGNCDFLEVKKKRMFIEHMLDKLKNGAIIQGF